jgi:predicted HTH domain antitoxin
MKQLNFRLSDEEYNILEVLSHHLNESIPNLSKKILLENLAEIRIKIALTAYQENKIGLKKAWKLSGLSFLEFNNLLVEHQIEPPIPEALDDKLIEIALDIKKEDLFKPKK